MRAAADADILAAVHALLPHLADKQQIARQLEDADTEKRFLAAIPGLKERAKTLVELIDNSAFLFDRRPLDVDDKAAKLLDPDARAVLAGLGPDLEKIDDWSAETTEAAIRSFAEARELKLGKVAQPLRAALTGKTTSPGIFDVLAVLGKTESLGRIADQAKAD